LNTDPHKRIRLTPENISQWAKFQSLLNAKQIRWDHSGRLRYLHGAPVGDLIFMRVDNDGKPIYMESAEEWFDPDSEKAKAFRW
jgi:hypothetical protein